MFEFIDIKYKNVLSIPSLYIKSGVVSALTGASGSGKTTVLKLLCKLISPTSGRITYNGEDINNIDTVSYRRRVTMLSQTPVLFSGSIKDNLAAGLRFRHQHIPADEVLIDILEQLKLKKTLDDMSDNLSGGEKQRLALGRILLLDSDVYLLDEPSSALDEQTERDIVKMLTLHANENKKTLVMVTHSKAAACEFADVIIEFSEGCIQKTGD